MSQHGGAGVGDLSLELVRRIQAGDREAWDGLYLRYHDALLFAIRCRLGSRLRARLQSEDVLHSVIKDAMKDLARFEPRGAGALGHYLHVCVLNKITKVKTDMAAGLLNRACHSEAEMHYIEYQRR